MHQIYLASFVGIRGIEPRSKPYESSVINHYTISPSKKVCTIPTYKCHRELLFPLITVAFNGYSTRVAAMGLEPIISHLERVVS